MNIYKVVWQFSKMPFLVGYNSCPDNPEGVPNNLPFELFIEPQTGVLRQTKNAAVDQALTLMYEKGSVIGPAMEGSVHKSYCDDFLSFVSEHAQIAGNSFLEIGAGTGYLLSQLQDQGAVALGIEPGASYAPNWERYKVDVIQGMFPHPNVAEQNFDCILSYAVMEHIVDYDQFLYSQIKLLDEGGILFVSVPDCEPYIRAADPSCFVHEHYSYFTRDTLCKALRKVGLDVVACGSANYGGALYAAAVKSSSKINFGGAESQGKESNFYPECFENMLNFKAYWLDRYELLKSNNKTVGVYCPSRALNVLASSMQLRFFDDDPSVYGKYLPGFESPIEAFADLEEKLVDEVWVFSYTFGELIRQKLKNSSLLNKVTVLCVGDLETELSGQMHGC